MIAIGCENISLSYGIDVILDKVTFSINEGERLGIVGVNGAGKTTLIRILMGETYADEGNVYIAKNKEKVICCVKKTYHAPSSRKSIGSNSSILLNFPNFSLWSTIP